jgi:putative transcriptional regulator
MNQISNIRARLRVTQQTMADGIGVTQGNVSNYERGQNMPPDVAERLIVWAKSLKLTLTFDDVYGPVKVSKPTRSKSETIPP